MTEIQDELDGVDSRCDDGMSTYLMMTEARPSGVVLPLVLRRKLRHEKRQRGQQQEVEEKEEQIRRGGGGGGGADLSASEVAESLSVSSGAATWGTAPTTAATAPGGGTAEGMEAQHGSMASASATGDALTSGASLHVHDENDDSADSVIQNYLAKRGDDVADGVFSSSDLIGLHSRVLSAMTDIQRQLHRGEESYYEHTDHGNIYKGWDAFVDAKYDRGASTQGGGTAGSQASIVAPSASSSAPSRRMPADHRWFSGSCRSVSTKAHQHQQHHRHLGVRGHPQLSKQMSSSASTERAIAATTNTSSTAASPPVTTATTTTPLHDAGSSTTDMPPPKNAALSTENSNGATAASTHSDLPKTNESSASASQQSERQNSSNAVTPQQVSIMVGGTIVSPPPKTPPSVTSTPRTETQSGVSDTRSDIGTQSESAASGMNDGNQSHDGNSSQADERAAKTTTTTA